MSRHPFLLAVATLPALILSPAATFAAPPNILVILADDLGYGDLGCYGGEIRTPEIDRLAAGDLRFTQFYNCARCCPSRASLLTGLYPHQAGVGEMDYSRGDQFPGYRGRLSEQSVTIAEVLRQSGYRTLMVGKWHVGKPDPTERGFDEFYGFRYHAVNCFEEKEFVRLPQGRPRREYKAGEFYSTDAITDYALDFLADARKKEGRPWFLYAAYNAPHFPLQAPKEDIDRYAKIYEQGWDRLREQRLERQKKLGLLPKGCVLSPRSDIPPNWAADKTGWSGKANPAWESLPADRRADLARRMAVYAAMVDRLDRNVGRLVADLRRAGELDNTLIFFLSDNGACAEWDPFGFDGDSGPKNVLHRGEDLDKVGGPDSYISYGSGWANAGNTPFRLYKHFGHEGGISTPLVVHWPAGIKSRGDLRRQPGHLIDLMATCVDVAGAKYHAEKAGRKVLPMEGRSLVPAFADRPLQRDFLAWEHEGNRALRAGDWKLVALKGKPWELYDLSADRVELNDLAGQHPERVKELAARWDTWAVRAGVYPSPVLGKKP